MTAEGLTFGFHKKRGIFLLGDELLSSEEGLCCMEVVIRDCDWDQIRLLFSIKLFS